MSLGLIGDFWVTAVVRSHLLIPGIIPILFRDVHAYIEHKYDMSNSNVVKGAIVLYNNDYSIRNSKIHVTND